MPRILITGDTHGEIDIKKFQVSKKIAELNEEDYLIILGDFGGIWDGSKIDEDILNMYADFPFTTLFIDGNHENFNLLEKYPVEDYCGGKIHKIRPNLLHLMRGYKFTIAGKTFLAIGGARSTDRDTREEDVDWWAQEMISDEEKNRVRKLLEKEKEFDYILTHCAPTTCLYHLMSYVFREDQDEFVEFLDREVLPVVDFKTWYFGHYHRNIDFTIGGDLNKHFIGLYGLITEIVD